MPSAPHFDFLNLTPTRSLHIRFTSMISSVQTSPARIRPQTTRALLALMGVSAAQSLFAASATWSASPTDANWATGANWGGTAPGATSGNNTDTATFNTALSGGIGGSGTPLVIDAGRVLGAITFDTANVGSYVIGSNAGNVLKVGSNSTSSTVGIKMTSTANASQVIAAPIQIAAYASSTNPQYTFSNDSTNSGATLSFTGNITANVSASRPTKLILGGANTGNNIISGNLSNPSFSQGVAILTKSGTGTWILSGSNTFSGTAVTSANAANGIQINAGKLVLQNNNALGSTSGSVNNYINNGGTLQLDATGTNGSITLNNNLTLQLMSGGTLSSNGSNTTASKVNVAASATSTISTVGSGDVFTIGDGANDFTGGSGAVVTISGPGTVLLSQASDYAGTLAVNAGTLRLGNATALGAASTAGVTFGASSAGKLQLNGNSATIASLNSNATVGSPVVENANASAAALTVSNTSGASTYAGVIQDGTGGGALSLVKNGASTLTVSGANTYTGGTTLTAGTLAANSTTALGTGAVTVASGATLSTNTATSFGALTLTGGGLLGLANFNSSFTAAGAIDISGTGNVLTLSGSTATSGNTYTLLSGSSLSASGISLTGTGISGLTVALGDTATIGRTNFAFSSTGTALQLAVTGGAFNLTWNGGSANWNATDANWQKDGAGSNIAFFSGDNITIATGDTIAVDAGGVTAGPLAVTNSSGTVTLNGGNLTATSVTKTGAGSLAVNNAVSTVGGINVSAGSVALNTANTVSGAITVSGGTLSLGANNAAGSGSATLTVSGGQFDLGTSNQSLSNVSLTGGSISGTTGVLTATGNAIDAQSGTVSGILGGSVGLTKTTSGTVILSGANTYTGATTISTGTLQIGDGGTTGSIDSTSGVTNNANLAYNRSDALTVGYAISGSGSLAQNGSGTTILTGANTYSGATQVNSGTLQIGNGGTTGSITSTSGVTNNATLAYNRSDAITAGYVISGTGSVVQNGTGTLTLSGSNTYSGGTTLNSGTLAVSNGSGLGTGTLTAANGTTVALQASFSNAITVSGTGASVTLTSNQASGGYGSNITGSADQTLTISGAGGQSVNFNNTTRQFTNFLGTVNVASGASLVDRSSTTTWTNGGDGTLFRVDGSVSSRNGGNWALGGLTGSGTLSMGGSGSNGIGLNYTIGARNDANDIFSGVIQDGDTVNGKVVSVTKVGTGTQTFSGANTYTGPTNITGGKLLVNGSIGVSTVTVDSGATLGGSGTIGGATTVNGTLAPGNSPGVLSFSNGLSLGSGATSSFEINGLTRGTEYDGVNVTGGSLAYGGTLSISFGAAIQAGTYDLFSFSGTPTGGFSTISIGGSFAEAIAGSPSITGSGWSASSAGWLYEFSNATGDLTLTAVPEPSAFAALAGLAGLGIAGLRRRRRT